MEIVIIHSIFTTLRTVSKYSHPMEQRALCQFRALYNNSILITVVPPHWEKYYLPSRHFLVS